MSKSKETGLAGRDALFNPPKSKGESPPQPKKPSKPKTMVTSVRLKPATVAKLQQLKIHILADREKSVTYGDILDEAIEDLYQKLGLESNV